MTWFTFPVNIVHTGQIENNGENRVLYSDNIGLQYISRLTYCDVAIIYILFKDCLQGYLQLNLFLTCYLKNIAYSQVHNWNILTSKDNYFYSIISSI
jgi:hypothetical protein